jgi:hypothetical protein
MVPVFGLALVAILALAAGCSRSHYRQRADNEVYRTIECAPRDPRWPLKDYGIQVDRRSRMFDPNPPDCPPMPPDDPVSHRFMHQVDYKKGWPRWHQYGDTPVVESPDWRQFLTFDEDGAVVLDQQAAMELALIHSREYQRALEDLYLSALDVTLQRFRFDVQFFGGNRTASGISGPLSGDGTESRTLSTDTNFQAERLFATGAQLLVEFANSVVWQFAGPDRYVSVNMLNWSLVQPLLRGAGRAVVLEQLTDAERTLLANIRQLERFRQGFYLAIIATGGSAGQGPTRGGFGVGSIASSGPRSAGGFYGLLNQRLRTRNQQSNTYGFRDNVERLSALFVAGRVSRIELDELLSSLYSSQVNLLRENNTLRDLLDDYKIVLGLPPQLEVKIEDPFLDPFNLIDPELLNTRDTAVRVLLDRLRASAAAGTDPVRQEELIDLARRVRGHLGMVQGDLERLVAALPERRKSLRGLAERPEFQRRDVDPGLLDIRALEERVAELHKDFAKERPRIEGILGAAWYRAGEWQTALEALEKSIQERAGQALDDRRQEDWVTDQFYLAMAYWRVGRQQDARLWYQRAVDWTVANKPGEETFIRISTEASELTGLANPLAPPEEPPLPGPEASRQFQLEARRQRLIRLLSRFSTQLTDLSLIQAKARLDTPTLVPIELDSDKALEIARQQRLDWMNARAALVDQWRQVEVVANELRGFLDLTFSGDLTQTSGTGAPNNNTIGSLQVGVEFDAPFTRVEERNRYRQTLIEYQRARREYYAAVDGVSQALRRTLRQIRVDQLEFELQREAVRANISRVVLIQLEIEEPPQPGQRQQVSRQTARNLTDSLDRLLVAQNSFLGVWLRYEVLRRVLDFDLGTMQLDERGMWIDPGPIQETPSAKPDSLELIPPGPEIIRPQPSARSTTLKEGEKLAVRRLPRVNQAQPPESRYPVRPVAYP